MFGEDRNDVESIRELLVWVNPTLNGRIKPMIKPPSLTRQARPMAVNRWLSDITAVVDAYVARGKQVSALLVHRDADGPDPTGAEEAALNRQLRVVRPPGQAVVPVQEIEAWWLLFPDAVEEVNPRTWRARIPRVDRDVETIASPKAELQRLTRGRHAYRESDSPRIAEQIRHGTASQHGRSASFERFRRVAKTL